MAKTISEIAADTGYSRTTVTMVLNGRASEYRISERSQKIIKAYVEKHGYTINLTARNLKTRRSHTIGFVVPDIANPFFARVMSHLETYCRAEGFVLITTSSSDEPDVENRAVKSLLSRGVDGLVIAPCTPRRPNPLHKRGKQTPIVLIDRLYPDVKETSVSSDHEENARLVTREIIAAGASQIVFLCGHPENPTIQDRITGFYGAASDIGFSHENMKVVSARDDSVAAGKTMMQSFLSETIAPPPAILCSSLLVLEGALQQLKRVLGEVPAEIVIATFDYDGFLEFLPNPALIIKQDEKAIAKAAFIQLHMLMQTSTAEKKQEKIIIASDLIHLGARSLRA